MTPERVLVWREAFGGRRFIMTVAAGIIHTLLMISGVISEQTYMALTMATVAAYITANTYEKVKANGNQSVV